MFSAPPKPDTRAIEEQLDRILASKAFAASPRSQKFLRYVVDLALSDSAGPPKEFAIAIDVFGRDSSYDPAIDATVRVQAGRLRSRLREYYAAQGKDDTIVIDMPTGGYAPVFSLREVAPPPSSPAPQVPPPDPAIAISTHRRLGLAPRLVLSLLALCLLAAATILIRRWTSRTDPPIRSLAVLPLENLSSDPDTQYFADGMTDELITEMAQAPELRVVSRTSAMQEKGSHEPLSDIARKLNVDAIVEGSVVRSNGRIRLNIQLVDTRTDRHLWAQSFEESDNDVLALQQRLALEIAAHARVLLAPPVQRPAGAPPVNPAAYDAYLRGLYFLNRREPARSASYFQQAISLDPTYDRAYSGLAEAIDSERTLNQSTCAEEIPQVVAAANKAIELNPNSGEAWSVLGILATDCQWDWKAAQFDLQRAIALSPNYSIAELRYALFLNVQGRQDEAEAHMRRALQLDPLSFWVTRQLGTQLYFERKYDEALDYLNRAQEMDPTQLYQIDNWSARAYEAKGLRDQAIAADVDEMVARFPEVSAQQLRSAYRTGGWRGYWTTRLDLTKPHADQYCVSYDLALGYVRLGQPDQAFFWLNRMMADRCYLITLLTVDPLMTPLRPDPRYHSLLRQLNLAS